MMRAHRHVTHIWFVWPVVRAAFAPGLVDRYAAAGERHLTAALRRHAAATAAACLLVLSLVACDKTTEGVLTVHNALQLSGEGQGWAEITAAAIGPGENKSCPDGRLAFATSNRVMVTDLGGKFVSDNTMPISESSPPWLIADNHLVKMKGGVLIHTFEGVTWDDSINPKPAWWDLTKTYMLKYKLIPGGRGNIYVFQSSDCGTSWQHVSNIDAATFTVAGTPGHCGHPRLRLDKNVKYAEAGGWDGHLVNVGDNGSDLYLTTPCAYGTPLGEGQATNEWHTDGLILRSVNSGKSWAVVCHLPDVEGSFWRVPVTTVPSGMVAFARARNGKLWLARFPATGTCDASGASDHLATDVAPDMRTDSQKAEATVNTNIWGFASIARGSIMSDNVQTSTYNWFDTGTRMGYKIVEQRADPAAPSTPSPLIIPITGAGDGSDILHGEFVEGPAGTRTNLFHYLERMPGTPNSFRIGFKLHEKGAGVGQGFLTLKGGKLYTWSYKDIFVGDYMTGDSYTSGNKIVFVTPWSQNGALYYNTVTWTPGS